MMTLTEEITLAESNGKRVGWRGWLALIVLMLPVLLVSVDNTVLSFALPDIALSLNPPAPSSCGSSTPTRSCSRGSW
jgi:DHA2 family multidrug resistance protein-like MFS transporter